MALTVTPAVQTRSGFRTVVPADQEFWACGNQPTPQEAIMMLIAATSPMRMWWPGSVSMRVGVNVLVIRPRHERIAWFSTVGRPARRDASFAEGAIRYGTSVRSTGQSTAPTLPPRATLPTIAVPFRAEVQGTARYTVGRRPRRR